MHLLSALAAGFAVLLKGPVALALIGPAAVAWLLVERRHTPCGCPPLRFLGRWLSRRSALPWFVWANRATGGEFVRVFFWYHTVARLHRRSESLASHPWWFYVPRFVSTSSRGRRPDGFFVWAVPVPGTGGPTRLFRFGFVAAVMMVVVLYASGSSGRITCSPRYPLRHGLRVCGSSVACVRGDVHRTVRRRGWAFGGSARGWAGRVAR